MPQGFRARALAVIGAFVFFVCSHAQAAFLPVGGAFLTPSEPDPFLGSVIGFISAPFSTPGAPLAPGSFSGVLKTTIIRDDPSNPYANIGNPNPALHGLTFVWQLTNDVTSKTSLSRMTNIDFSLFLTDISYQPGAGLLPPTSSDRTSGPPVLGWRFDGTPLGLGRVTPGTTTTLLVAQTNAPGFVDVMANIIDGSVVQAPTYGPDLSPIAPEPATATLLLVVAGVAMRRRLV